MTGSAFDFLTAIEPSQIASVAVREPPRAVALLLALVALIGFVAGPAQSLVSRRIESRADVHSLDLTVEPAAFVAMQRRLATVNLSAVDPSPLEFGMFAINPTAPHSIAISRSW